MADGIEIIIRGPTAVGKTTVATIIADQLRMIGLPVLEPDDLEDDYKHMRKYRHEALAILRSRQTPVAISEKQARVLGLQRQFRKFRLLIDVSVFSLDGKHEDSTIEAGTVLPYVGNCADKPGEVTLRVPSGRLQGCTLTVSRNHLEEVV